MRDRFKEATLVPSAILKYDSNGESDFLLLENEWIRIHLVRFQKDESRVLIEVELSLPDLPTVENQQESKKILQSSIEYFYYLEKLGDYEFNLSVVERDCIWIANKLIAIHQDDLAFFELLVGSQN